MEKILKLYAELRRGTDYFNRYLVRSGSNPVIRRLVAEFHKDVVEPFDEACARLEPEQRKILEDQI